MQNHLLAAEKPAGLTEAPHAFGERYVGTCRQPRGTREAYMPQSLCESWLLCPWHFHFLAGPSLTAASLAALPSFTCVPTVRCSGHEVEALGTEMPGAEEPMPRLVAQCCSDPVTFSTQLANT